MTIRAFPVGSAGAASTIRAAFSRLGAAAKHIREHARDREAQFLLHQQLDQLDDFHLADVGLEREEKQVGWHHTAHGEEPLPVTECNYQPLAEEASEKPTQLPPALH